MQSALSGLILTFKVVQSQKSLAVNFVDQQLLKNSKEKRFAALSYNLKFSKQF